MEDHSKGAPEDSVRELSLEDIVRIFRRRFWWFCGIFAVTVLGTLGYLFVSTPIYESTVTVRVQAKDQSSVLGGLFSVGLQIPGSTSDLSTEVELIKSRSNLERVVHNLGLVEIFVAPDSPDRKNKTADQLIQQVVRSLDQAIQVTPVRNTSIIRITAELPQAQLATDIVNELARVYNHQLEEFARREISIKKEFIEAQLPQAEKELLETIHQIREFKERTGVFTLSLEAEYVFSLLSTYDSEIIRKNLEIQTTTSAIRSISEQLQIIDPHLIASETISLNPLVSELRSKLANSNIELATLERMYPITDPRIIQKKKEIEEIQSELSHQVMTLVTSQQKVNNPIYNTLLADLVSNEIKLIIVQTTSDSLNRVRGDIESRLRDLPALEQQLLDLQRLMKLKEEVYTLLYKNYEETRISEAAVVGRAYIVDSALTPTNPVKPQRMLTLAIGGVLGVFLGVLLVFLIEFFDPKIRSREEVKRMLSSAIPVLGTIPKWSPKTRQELYTKSSAMNAVSEAYKMAANHLALSLTTPNPVIAVTSPAIGEGKTTLIANIAYAYAQQGEKVAIINLDMRNPRMERVLSISPTHSGIVEYFQQPIPSEIPMVGVDENLDLLPVGSIPSNPASIIGSRKLEKLIEWLKQRYDRVLIDTPPVTMAADVSLIASRVDGVLLVGMVHKTTKPSLKAALQALFHTRVPILGMVIHNTKDPFSA